jgi:hypothetical protein
VRAAPSGDRFNRANYDGSPVELEYVRFQIKEDDAELFNSERNLGI